MRPMTRWLRLDRWALVGVPMIFTLIFTLLIEARASAAPAAPSAAPAAGAVRVILVGDSTMANDSGYGDALCRNFRPEVTCINAAKGGRSTHSYREEGSWATVMKWLGNAGGFSTTYVLIQFGHNDQPGKPGRSTTLEQFGVNLRRYVEDVRGTGAIPVLVTPLTRRQFAGGKLADNLEPWADSARRVAKEAGVTLLDLHADSMKAVQGMGPRRSNELAHAPAPPDVVAAARTGTTVEVPKPPPHPSGLPPAPLPLFDYTHVGPRGADLFGGMVAREIRTSIPALAPSLVTQPPTGTSQLPHVFNIWRGVTPGGDKVTVTPSVIERSVVPTQHDRALLGVIQPTLTIYSPAHPNGSAVLILPGGAYLRVVIDKEGEETARRLNEQGITAAVLTYRLPADGWAAGRDAPLQDAQRALRLLKSGIAGPLVPGRIGVLGFSAGGDLAAALALRHAAAIYERTDQADLVSARPDFTVLMYPALNMAVVPPGGGAPIEAKTPLASLVTSEAPPSFIVHAADDSSVPVERSLEMFAALKAAHVPAEMHVFSEGGHGFGVRLAAGKPVASWPDLLVRWGQQHEFFPGGPARPTPVAAQTPSATDWRDAVTGHRVVRLTDDAGGSTPYFHDNAFSPQGDKLMFNTPAGIAVVDVAKIGTRGAAPELVVPGARRGYFARRSREIYTNDAGSSIRAVNVDTKAARDVRNASGIVNADETLSVVKNAKAVDPDGTHPKPAVREAVPQLQRMFPGKQMSDLTPEQQYSVTKEDGLAARALNPALQSFVYTNLATGASSENGFQYGDLNHLQFNPVDPNLLLYCYEGTWHELERTWTIRTDGSQRRLMHTRTMPMEINGHEWWSWDGRTVWFDLQTPRSQVFWIAGVNLQTGREVRYHIDREAWGVHFNSSRDDTLFASDGGDPSQVAQTNDGRWINLFRVLPNGTLAREKLASMADHNYVTGRGGVEPNVHITPDKKWVVFTGQFGEQSRHVYAVAIGR